MSASRRTLDRTVSEAALQKAILEMAGVNGWLRHHVYDARRNPTAPRRSGLGRYLDPGFPDLALCRGPVLWLPELKTEDGRVSDDQAAWMAALREVRRVETGVWRPRDLDEIERLLSGEGC